MSPLHLACHNNESIEQINFLLKAKGDINEIYMGYTLVHHAIKNNASLDLIKHLMEDKKFNKKFSKFNDDLLHFALKCNKIKENEEIVELVEYRLKEKDSLKTDNEVIHLALDCTSPKGEVIKLLINKNARVNEGIKYTDPYNTTTTPVQMFLMKANSLKDLDLIKGLVEQSIEQEVEIQGSHNINFHLNKYDYFSFACENKEMNVDVLKYLLECGFSLEGNKNKALADSPIYHAFYNPSISMEVIKFLMENGANFGLVDSFKNSPLHLLSANKSVTIEMIDYLLESKLDLNQLNEKCQSPIQYCLSTNQRIDPFFLKSFF
eukprot:TRINITY_DN17597_c0_g1_i1.p1 TRINITY_DN17597_c0_g1~~TRINITY_DN17597_c0_g1_i1.p1  ORF type:complete len:321 (+),score=79.35 TRINITY_DN17597_c0_g1_i1:35-997(+)